MANDDLWHRADSIFEAALDLPRDKRADWVNRACDGNAELQALVERLLADAETETDEAHLLTGGVGELLPDLANEILVHSRTATWYGDAVAQETRGTKSFHCGTRLGAYRVIRELGRGGMAVVDLAERADGQFEQLVALKRIKRGIDTDEVIRRFEQERQILARLHHPHIAQLLDGGVGEDGRPYFVMEYVEGQPIDLFADQRRLSLEGRLGLFLQAARASAHAHRHLVVHRDIKPSNILVDDTGHVKLLDFGIAKLLGSEPRGGDITLPYERPMTPRYASPEQALGAPVTTASDIYQLGVLLYVLLTGRWPYPLEGGDSDALARAICEREPTRPSTAATAGERTAVTYAASAGEIAEIRGLTPQRLRRCLSGDLDNIVLKTLRKEPERRYASVAQLIDDLERYRDSLPVQARPSTFLYRAGKFARRHRTAVATAMAALVLLVTLAVFYTVQLKTERDRARLAAARANQTVDFLRGLFAVSAPTRSKGEQVTARQLLDRGARRVEDGLAGEPELQADMMTVIGDVYRELAFYEEAEPLLERAVVLRRQGAEPAALVASLTALARVREEREESAAAEALYREALELGEAVFGPRHPEVGRILAGLGRVEELKGDFAAAREYFERALGVLNFALDPDHPDIGLVLKDLGGVLRQVRDLDPAKERLAKALRILERSVGEDHPWVAEARIDLGDALRFTGEEEAARLQYEAGLRVAEQVYGEDHPAVAHGLNKLANLENALGEPDAAIAHHERALSIRRAAWREDHPLVAASLNNLGLVHWGIAQRELEAGRPTSSERQYEIARNHFSDSVRVYETALGEEHVDVAIPLHNLGRLLVKIERYGTASPHLERVVKIREAAYGTDHSLLASPLFWLGRLRFEEGAAAVAEPLLRRALRLGRNHDPYRHPEIIRPRISLGRCLAALGRFGEAEELLLVTIREEGVDLPSQRLAHEGLTELYEKWGKLEEAARHRRAAEEIESEV